MTDRRSEAGVVRRTDDSSHSGEGPHTADRHDFEAAAVRLRPLPMIAPSILDMVYAVTGLESAYIAEIDLEDQRQTVLFAQNHGALRVAEGVVTPWSDTLCRRALVSGIWATEDVRTDLPGSAAAEELDIHAFVSVPIIGAGDELLATLCGASRDPKQIAGSARPVLLVLAQLISEHWDRGRAHTAALSQLGDMEQLARDHGIGLAEAEHQLKSPLAIIGGWAETLLDEEDVLTRPRLRRGMTSILEASQRAVVQLDALLVDARDRSLANALPPSLVDLSALSERIADDLTGICGPRHQIVRQIEPGLWIEADPEAAGQALWHLAENAVKYSPDGGVVNLELARVGETGDVAFTITDDGLGLPTDPDAPDIFRAFVRGQNTAAIQGTGLGLHIVRRLVTAMNGTVSASPAPGHGSRFVVTLPESRLAGMRPEPGSPAATGD